MDHGDHGGGESMEMTMAMYFHAGTKETILFKPWETDSTIKFVAAFIGVFLLGVIYEALKFYREILYETKSDPLLERSSESLLTGVTRKIFRSCHLIQTLLHMVQLILSYFLMLIFMTYNVWLAVAITLGTGVGYLLFGWNKRSATDITEHCH